MHWVEEELVEEVYVDVILPLPLQGTFSYRLGEEFKKLAKVGARVLVPFGKGKMYTGVIEKIHKQNPGSFHIHFIQELIDKNEVLISEKLIAQWKWIATYYMCPLGEVYNAGMPAGLNFNSLTYVELNPEIYWQDEELNPTEYNILSVIELKKKITVKDLEKEVRSKTSLLKTIKDLFYKDLILISEDIQQAYKPKTETYIKVSEIFRNEKIAREQIDLLQKKAPKQYELLLTLLGMPGREAKKTFLEESKGINPATILALRNKKLIMQEKREVSRLNLEATDTQIPALTDFQTNVKS
jgi:primosomal protein N' (replication factor Y)